MRGVLVVLVPVVLALTSGCADLSPITAGSCGNGIVEPEFGEDCDSYPAGSCRPAGAPLACRFDCSELADHSRRPCPAGYACNTSDSVCLLPSGEFEPFADVPGDGSSPLRLATADFDFDRLTDLVVDGPTALQIHYASSTGGFAKVLTKASVFRPPVVGQLTADELADVAIAADEGVVVARGRGDRTMQPTVYAPFELEQKEAILKARAIALDAMPPQQQVEPTYGGADYIGDEVVIMVDSEKVSALLLGIGVSGESAKPVKLDGKVEQLAALPAVGQVVEDPVSSPCEEVVYAFQDEDRVHVFSPCYKRADGTYDWNADEELNPKVPIAPVMLPSGNGARGVFLTAVNSDQHLDMLIRGAHQGYGEVTLVAYGTGTGRFHSKVGDLPTLVPEDADNQAIVVDNAQCQTELACACACGGYDSLLAVGDVNADKQLDFVCSQQVCVSVPPVSPAEPASIDKVEYVTTASFDYSFDQARIADFNQNGRLDIVLASSGQGETISRPSKGGSPAGLGRSELVFLNGVGNGLFNAFEIPLGGPPGELAVGDFDGDLLPDVALPETGEHDSSKSKELGDSLVVAFGNGFGPPSTPVNMGRLAHIDQVVAGNLVSLGGGPLDGIADLVVLSCAEGSNCSGVKAARSAAFLFGASDRQLVSAFKLKPNADAPAEPPEALAIGQFDGDEVRHPDLAALSKGPAEEYGAGSPRLWLLPCTGEAAIEASSVKPTDPLAADSFGYPQPLMAAVDLGGEGGRDELVLLGNRQEEDKTVGRVVVAEVEVVDGEHKWSEKLAVKTVEELYCAGAGCAGSYCGGAVSPLEPEPETGGSEGGANGDVEMTALFDYEGQLQVVDVNSDGRPDVVALAAVPQADEPNLACVTATMVVVFPNDGKGGLDVEHRIKLASPLAESPTSFVVLNVDRDPEPELVLLTASGAFAADLDLAAKPYLTNVRRLEGRSGTLPGGTRIAAGDFDGNGLADLAIAASGGVGVFTGRPVLP